MATKTIPLGALASELTRRAMIEHRSRTQAADNELKRVMRLVRRDAGVPDEANVNVTTVDGAMVLQVEEPDEQVGLALVEGADAPTQEDA